jgi:SnoaL-like protein
MLAPTVPVRKAVPQLLSPGWNEANERRDPPMDTTAALEAIRRLKYAYFRTLDLKEWDELGLLLTEDATAAYEDGKTVLEGRAAIVRWLSEALSSNGIVTEHHGHHPEIELTSDSTANGTWYLQDRVIIPGADLEIGGTAFYTDRYEKTTDGWRISHTGYMRVFEEHRTHSTLAVRSFSSRFSASD